MHKSLVTIFASAALSGFIPQSANAIAGPARVELPRAAALGVGLVPAPEGQPGALVDAVMPGLTAEKMALRKGDIVTAANGTPIASTPELVEFASSLDAGMPVTLTVRRIGADLQLRGKAVGRPFETYPDAKVDYGAVPFRDGALRDILVTPAGAKDPPVLFLLQGFSCVSIEPPQPGHPYRQLGANIVKAGIAYYRVEKPGLGDSNGSTKCADIDYATELDAFRAAYRHLVEVRGFSPDRIFMFGHSLGGLEAPMLAAETPPRGVAVYGTVYRNWADYHRNVAAFQPYLVGAEDPVETAARLEQMRGMFERFYFLRQSPAQIAADVPALADPLRDVLAWTGGDTAMGRNYKYLADLAHQPIAKAWRDSKTNVLSLYGESDLVALFDEDHRLIAEVVNRYRPGTARFIEVPRTDHGMTLVGSREDVIRRSAGGAQPPSGDFNPEVARLLAEWIRESMAKPPVRTASKG